jgi:hypothetical protein
MVARLWSVGVFYILLYSGDGMPSNVSELKLHYQYDSETTGLTPHGKKR